MDTERYFAACYDNERISLAFTRGEAIIWPGLDEKLYANNTNVRNSTIQD